MCVKTEGGVGIVCRQMNLRGETNEECRKKERTILIGFSLFFFFLGGEQEIVGFTEVRWDFLHWHCTANWSVSHAVTYFGAVFLITDLQELT